MKKFIENLVQLGKGAPWIYILMSHLYTSLAFALKSNTKLLKKSSNRFREYIKQSTTKIFWGKQLNHQRHVNFVMKKAAKMVNKRNHLYLLNSTMQDELIFISHALLLESGIKFETLIAHLMIPVLAQPTNLVKKHKDLIIILHWVKEDCNSPDLV